MFLELMQFSAQQSKRRKTSAFGPEIIAYGTIESLASSCFEKVSFTSWNP
jgi:hypothetical protein